MIENYLEKNYSIKNNKIVSKRFVEETDFISLVCEVKKIFSISENDSFNYVFNFTKSYGYDLNCEYGYFDGNFIKIDEFNLITEVEEVETNDMFAVRMMRRGKTKTEIDFKITHEPSKGIIIKKSNEALASSVVINVAPLRYDMYYKGFYYSLITIKSMSISDAWVHVIADVDFFTTFKDELKSV